MNKTIDLGKYKASNSTIYTGRPQGESVRDKIELDKEDKNLEKIIFLIPEETTSLNPSFYLGLLFKSIKKLGIEAFTEKYSFDMATKDESTKTVLQRNLEDGMRNALNIIDHKTGLRLFIDKLNNE